MQATTRILQIVHMIGLFISRFPLFFVILTNNVADADTPPTGQLFTALKSINGNDACAVDIGPVMSFEANFKTQCLIALYQKTESNEMRRFQLQDNKQDVWHIRQRSDGICGDPFLWILHGKYNLLRTYYHVGLNSNSKPYYWRKYNQDCVCTLFSLYYAIYISRFDFIAHRSSSASNYFDRWMPGWVDLHIICYPFSTFAYPLLLRRMSGGTGVTQFSPAISAIVDPRIRSWPQIRPLYRSTVRVHRSLYI